MACLGLSGCGDSGTHTRLVFALDPSLISRSSVQVSGVRALESEPHLPDITSSDGLSFQLENAGASLVDLRLKLGRDRTCADVRDSLASGVGCEDGGDGERSVLTFAGPFLVDLSEGTVVSGGALEIPPGTYGGIDFRLGTIVSGGHGFEAGTRLFKDGRGWSMALTLPPGETLRFGGDANIEVEEGGSVRVLFRQETWLQDLPLASCFQKGELTLSDSVLSLDAARGECAGAGDRMRANVRTHGSMREHPF